MRALALTMKDQGVIILMNDLAADYRKLADKSRGAKLKRKVPNFNCWCLARSGSRPRAVTASDENPASFFALPPGLARDRRVLSHSQRQSHDSS
jgi:hypothetical protein